jgi:type 1 fimbria pilin
LTIIREEILAMQKFKNLQIKGFVAGMLVMLLLSGATVFAASRTQSINITFNGIRLVVNGELVTPRDGAGNVVEPFIWNGTTYLPVRAVASALGQEVDWDGNTQTVYIGQMTGTQTPIATPETPPTPSRQNTALREAAPFFDRNPSRDAGGVGSNNLGISFHDTANMGGVAYRDMLLFRTGGGMSTRTVFSLHNLNGQFTTLSGQLGRIDGSEMTDVTFNFYGDGTFLKSYELTAANMPISINVSVEGVTQLRVEKVVSVGGRSLYALNGFLE